MLILHVIYIPSKVESGIWLNCWESPETERSKKTRKLTRAANGIPPCTAESIECFIEDPAFLRSYDSAPPSPLPHPPLLSLIMSLPDGRGGRRLARSQIIRPWESLALYISINTRWCKIFTTAVQTQWVRWESLGVNPHSNGLAFSRSVKNLEPKVKPKIVSRKASSSYSNRTAGL